MDILGAYLITEGVILVVLLAQIAFSQASKGLGGLDDERAFTFWERIGLHSARARVIAAWVVLVLPMFVIVIAAVIVSALGVPL